MGSTHLIEVNVQNELEISDYDLSIFVQNLSVAITPEYSKHNETVIDALKVGFRVSLDEARNFLYPSAQTFVANLSSKREKAKRTMQKSDFFLKYHRLALYSTRGS